MIFDIDPGSGLAIYDQVVRQIKFAIARGTLAVGDRLPSVRELAKELVINPNTIARSFQTLQAEGLIEPLRGIGFQVAAGAPDACRLQRQLYCRQRLSVALREARLSGLSTAEIEQVFRDCLVESESVASSQEPRS